MFNARIAQLASRAVNQTYNYQTVDDIRQILGADAKSLEIINLWYEGRPEMRSYLHLDAVDWTFPPTIDGEYLHFAGKLDGSGIVHDFILGEDTSCSQFSLYSGISDEQWVANVSGPLPAGWNPDADENVITINHSIDPDTGEFSITAIILDSALSSAKDLSLTVLERTGVVINGLCEESTNYSQVPVAAGRIPPEQKQAGYFHLNAVDWTFPPTIDGEYLHFAGITNEPGMVHNFVLDSYLYCSQFSLYRNVINQEWVASISDPLLVGWKHNEVPKIVVVNDKINPATGEFSVTARINDLTLAIITKLSLLVRNRVEADETKTCRINDSYSQVAVSEGQIPAELKVDRHYHVDAIEWTDPPAISGTSLTFAGLGETGTIDLRWRDDYCSQFSLYERDERGYHRIASLASLLPENTSWTNPQSAELVKGWTYTDGKFNATAKLSPDLLSRYRNLILVVRTPAAVDQATRNCGDSEVLSAIDIQRN